MSQSLDSCYFAAWILSDEIKQNKMLESFIPPPSCLSWKVRHEIATNSVSWLFVWQCKKLSLLIQVCFVLNKPNGLTQGRAHPGALSAPRPWLRPRGTRWPSQGGQQGLGALCSARELRWVVVGAPWRSTLTARPVGAGSSRRFLLPAIAVSSRPATRSSWKVTPEDISLQNSLEKQPG